MTHTFSIVKYYQTHSGVVRTSVTRETYKYNKEKTETNKRKECAR